VPPYSGVPRLFHQFPVLVVVAVIVVDTEVVEVVVIPVAVVGIEVEVVGRVEVVFVDGAEVVVDWEQETNISDITMRSASNP